MESKVSVYIARCKDAKLLCVRRVTVRIGEEYELDKRRLVKSAHVSARIVVVRLK